MAEYKLSYTASEINKKLGQISTVPDYIEAESNEVITRILEAQTSERVINLATIADMHYELDEHPEGVLHASNAIEYISKRVPLDALLITGDHTDLYMDNDYTQGMEDILTVNALLQTSGLDKLVTYGNHDYHEIGSLKTAKAIQGKCKNVVWGSYTGGYYYRDFDDYKVRIIIVNTNETGGGNQGICCSDEQYNWFIDTLDISTKTDAEEWQILILSHHPLDYYEKAGDGVYRFAHIIDAYTKGESWSGGGLSCNYENKNTSKIICNVHGHLHNFLVDKIYIGNPDVTTDKCDVYRVCLPESCFNRPQSYTGVWQTENTYTKTANTAQDTAFNILCIDLKNHTINAINYGAGIDRTISYVTIDNMITKSIGSDGSLYNGGQGWKASTRLNSSGAEASNSEYYVTGFIPVTNGDYLYLKNMNFVIDSLTNQGNTRAVLYDSNFTMKQITTTDTILDKAHWGGSDGYILNENGEPAQMGDTIGRLRIVNAEAAYIRFSTKGISSASVISKNQEIS